MRTFCVSKGGHSAENGNASKASRKLRFAWLNLKKARTPKGVRAIFYSGFTLKQGNPQFFIHKS